MINGVHRAQDDKRKPGGQQRQIPAQQPIIDEAAAAVGTAATVYYGWSEFRPIADGGNASPFPGQLRFDSIIPFPLDAGLTSAGLGSAALDPDVGEHVHFDGGGGARILLGASLHFEVHPFA